MARIISDLVYRLTVEQTELAKGLKKANADVDALSKKFTDVGKKLTLGLTVPIIGAGAAMVKLASDTAESLNAANVVFKDSTKVITEWGKNSAEQAGLTSAQFYQASAVIGAGLINAGASAETAANQTIELTKRAADMASIFNTDVNEALVALQAGLRGESEPLRRFAVSLDEASVQAKAVQLGLADSAGEVDAYGKSQARLALIMEQSNRFQGDFVNTSDQLANGTRVTVALIKEQAAELGTQLLPIILQVVQTVKGLVSGFSELTDEQKKTILIVGGIAAAFGPMLIGIGNVVKAISTLKTAFIGLGAASPIIIGLALVASTAVAIGAGMKRAAIEAQNLKDAIAGVASIEQQISAIKKQQEIADSAAQAATFARTEESKKRLTAEAVAQADILRRLRENLKYEYIDIEAKKIAGAEAARRAEAELAALGKTTAAKAEANTVSVEDARLAADEEFLARIEAQEAFYDADVALAKEAAERRKAEARQAVADTIAIYEQLTGGLTAIFDQIATNQNAALDYQAQADKEYIENSTMSAEEKAAAIEKLDRETAIRKAELAREQAIFEKAGAVASIAINTAKAIVQALPNIPLSIAIGALGAVQAGLVLAQPLPPVPKFADGGSFVVPPGFGNDSFPIPAAMVESGERVTVESAQEVRNGGKSVSIPVSFEAPGFRSMVVGTIQVALRDGELVVDARKATNMQAAIRGAT